MTDAQLQAFVAVAEQGSFTIAGRQLGLTQSAVSKAVTGLEESLRVALLIRHARGVHLTDVGQRMVVRAREILHLKALMRQDAEATSGLRQGSVRVGSFGISSSRHLLPPMLEAFSRAYPGIPVTVIEGSDQEVEHWLREGRVDVCFVTLPSEEFDTIRLAQDEMTAVLPANHPLAAETRIAPRQLSQYPFIMSTGGCEPAVRELLCEAPLRVRYHIREGHTILALIQQGAGVTIMPSLALPNPLPEGVVCRPLDPPSPRAIGLAVAGRKEASPACRAFLKVAQLRR